MPDAPSPELLRAAKEFVEFAQVATNQADEKFIIGWVIVSYDPEFGGDWSAVGLYTDPRVAQEHARRFNKDITHDGSPGVHRLILPVYQWPSVEEANREAT